MIGDRDGKMYDVAFDLQDLINKIGAVADHSDTTPEEHNKINRVWVKLKDAFGDLNSLLPAPISNPTHQSR